MKSAIGFMDYRLRRRVIKATETLILKESFEYCPYIRAIKKEQKRNAQIRDDLKSTDDDLDTDIPQATRLKAHLKRRVERQTKQKWVKYATEYASEIVFAGPEKKDEIRRYIEMTRDAVMEMNRKDKEEKKASHNRSRMKYTPFNEETY